MAGLLDSLFGGGDPGGMGILNNPKLIAALGAMQGMGPTLGYSRLPQTTGQTMAGAAGGLLGGIQAGTQQQAAQQNLTRGGLGIADSLIQMNIFRKAMGMPPLTIEDVKAGNVDSPNMDNAFAGTGLGGQGQQQQPEGIVSRETPPPQEMVAPQQDGGQPPMPQGAPPAMPQGQPPQMPPQAGPTPPQGLPMPQQAGPAPQPQAPPPMPPQGQPMGAGGNSFLGVRLPAGMSPQAYAVLTKMNPQAAARVIGNQYPGPTALGQLIAERKQMAPGDPLASAYDLAIAKAQGVAPVLGGNRPNVPIRKWNPATGQYEIQPGQLQEMGQFQSQEANIREGAALARSKAEEAYKYGLKTGEAAPGGQGGVGGPPSPAGPSPVAPLPGRKAPADAIMTPKGTVVPSPMRQVLGPGEIQIKNQLDSSTKTEENWNAVRGSLETSRQRLMDSAAAFQQVEGKGFNEHRAEIANNLRGLGMDKIANMVMSGAETDAVKQAIWYSMQESLTSLKAINAGTGGRILNSEFNAFMEHGFSPDMPADTLHKAISAQLGTTFQIGNMIDDYFTTGKQAGWRDANQFQSQYLQKNPIENFVNYASKSIGQFKGQSATATKPGPGVTHIWVPDKGIVPVSP